MAFRSLIFSHRTTQADEFIVSNGSPHVMMYLQPGQPAEGVLTEGYALSKHGEFFGSPTNGFSFLRPAMPLSVEHARVVAAAGLLDNTEVESDAGQGHDVKRDNRHGYQ